MRVIKIFFCPVKILPDRLFRHNIPVAYQPCSHLINSEFLCSLFEIRTFCRNNPFFHSINFLSEKKMPFRRKGRKSIFFEISKNLFSFAFESGFQCVPQRTGNTYRRECTGNDTYHQRCCKFTDGWNTENEQCCDRNESC